MFVLFGYDARSGWNLICVRWRLDLIEASRATWAVRYAHVAIVGPGCSWQGWW